MSFSLSRPSVPGPAGPFPQRRLRTVPGPAAGHPPVPGYPSGQGRPVGRGDGAGKFTNEA